MNPNAKQGILSINEHLSAVSEAQQLLEEVRERDKSKRAVRVNKYTWILVDPNHDAQERLDLHIRMNTVEEDILEV